MSKIYETRVKITGYITCYANADTEEQAREATEKYVNEQNFDPLDDINYELDQTTIK